MIYHEMAVVAECRDEILQKKTFVKPFYKLSSFLHSSITDSLYF